MVGEEYGWVALEGWTIFWLILEMLILVLIPGFLLGLAIFPKRNAMPMSERMALSFGLGLSAPFLLALLNISLKVKVDYVSSLMVFIFVCIVGMVIFLNRGGNINLLQWYKTKEAAKS